jgi:hypothetical protein
MVIAAKDIIPLGIIEILSPRFIFEKAVVLTKFEKG